MKSFFRKVGFGLKPGEKAPSDPLTWAQKQVETIPELNWKGKYIFSEKEMITYEYNFTLSKIAGFVCLAYAGWFSVNLAIEPGASQDS